WASDRVEDRLRRLEEAEPVRPAVERRRAVGVLPGDRDAVGRVVDRARAALVLAVFRHQQLAFQGMFGRREAQAEGVAEAPGHRLDAVHRARYARAQDRA